MNEPKKSKRLIIYILKKERLGCCNGETGPNLCRGLLLRAQPVQWTQVYHRHCFFVISLRRRVSRLFRRGARETGIVCLLLFLGRWAYIEVHAYGHGCGPGSSLYGPPALPVSCTLHVSLFETTFLRGKFADSITLTVIFSS